jgi:tetratricopeptide (TPR) repeat protein
VLSEIIEKVRIALEQGDAESACVMLEPVEGQLTQPDTLFMAAVAFARGHRYPLALDKLKRLHDLGYSNQDTRSLHAEILTALGRHQLAATIHRQIIEAGDTTAERQFKLATALFASDQVSQAEAILAHPALTVSASLRDQVLLLRGRCLAALNRIEEARMMFSRVNPAGDLGDVLRYRRARLHMRTGDFDAAAEELQQLISESSVSDAAQTTWATNAIHSGRIDEARRFLKRALQDNPSLEMMMLALDLATETGDTDTETIWRATWDTHADADLFRALHSRFMHLDDHQHAQWLRKDYARRADKDQHWEWAQLKGLLAEKDYAQVEQILRATQHREAHQEATALLAFAQGDYAAALAAAQHLCQQRPADQYYNALVVTAFRCLGDPRVDLLIDAKTLVTETALPIAEDRPLWETICQVVRRQHLMHHSPLLQSVRQGTQTPGHLFLANQIESMNRLLGEISSAAYRLFDRLAGDALAEGHPIRRHRPTDISLHTSWSILARGDTFHVSHVHNKGWYSGSCYLEVPNAINSHSDAGYLIFGEPPFETRDPLPATGFVKPTPGKLALFPSYFWHSTRPFNSEGERLMVAFDFGVPDRAV